MLMFTPFCLRQHSRPHCVCPRVPFHFSCQGVTHRVGDRCTMHDTAHRRQKTPRSGGTLRRDEHNAVSIPGVQHVGSAGHSFPYAHTVVLPPGGFIFCISSSPSPGVANVHAVYAAAEPSPKVQPHVIVRALLLWGWKTCPTDQRVSVACQGPPT